MRHFAGVFSIHFSNFYSFYFAFRCLYVLTYLYIKSDEMVVYSEKTISTFKNDVNLKIQKFCYRFTILQIITNYLVITLENSRSYNMHLYSQSPLQIPFFRTVNTRKKKSEKLSSFCLRYSFIFTIIPF